MKKEDTLRLNTHFLSRRIELRGIKLWWLAEQLGVDRKTVSRWVTGKVKRLARANATALAGVLDCRLADVTVSDEADVLATREQQRVAAGLVQQQDLLGLLAPSENYALAESIIKATLQPDLPLAQLGRLYNLLAIASWRQARYIEANAYVARALDIGVRLDDRAIQVKAWFNQATIDSLLSHHKESLDKYLLTLMIPEHFEDARTHASAHFNAGMVLRDFARFDEALAHIDEALALFDAHYNLAIGWTGRGILLTEMGRTADALAALDRATHHAVSGQVVRYRDAVPLYRGDALCLAGDVARGRPLVESGFAALTGYPVHDLACHEIRARSLRLAGDPAAAQAAIDAGLAATAEFPTARAYLLEELCRLDPVHRAATNALWTQLGLAARVRDTVQEYGG